MRHRIMALAAVIALLAAAAGPVHAKNIYSYTAPSGTVHLSDFRTTSEYRQFCYFRLPADMDRGEIMKVILREAKRHGVDPALVTAMVEVESGFRVGAVSPKGAQGLMQIMPGTARDLKLSDSMDGEKNIEAGTRYLRQLLDRFNGDVKLALAAYNAGPGAVSRCGGVPPISETKQYIKKIQSRYGKAI